MKENPSDNIRALSEISMVMVNGNIIHTKRVKRRKKVDDLLDLVWSN